MSGVLVSVNTGIARNFRFKHYPPSRSYATLGMGSDRHFSFEPLAGERVGTADKWKIEHREN